MTPWPQSRSSRVSPDLTEQPRRGRIGLRLCGSAADDRQAHESWPIGCGIGGSSPTPPRTSRLPGNSPAVEGSTDTADRSRRKDRGRLARAGTMSSVIETRPLATTLAAVPLFSGLDETSLDSVGRGMRSRRFRRGEVIFHLGDPGDALFVVMSGAVKITCPRRRATRRSWPRSGRGTSSASWPCSTARPGRRPRPRSSRPRRWSSPGPVSRADRDRAGDPRRPAGRAGQGAPTADAPRRGAPFPRHCRAARRAAGEAVRRAGPAAGRWQHPAGRADHPERSRVDGRLHPAVGQQAAGTVRRRRADPPRARRDRDRQSRRAGPHVASLELRISRR